MLVGHDEPRRASARLPGRPLRVGPNTQTPSREGLRGGRQRLPPFDFGADGGPDYSPLASEAYWFGEAASSRCIPNTGAFVGFLRRAPTPPTASRARRPGPGCPASSRASAPSTACASPPRAYRRRQRHARPLLARGVRMFGFSLHSPSLMPGCTPYVRRGDLEAFLDRCRRFFDFFLGESAASACPPDCGPRQ